MKSIQLGIRTAVATVYAGPVQSIRAEDLDGWFGIRPGRRNLAAVLPPGLLLIRDADGEGFVAMAGGLLDLYRDRCRVMTRDAVFSRQLDQLGDRVASLTRQRLEAPAAQRDVFNDLAKEALRRLKRQELAR